MSNKPNSYIPGVCNIGNAEIVKRRLFGWVGLVLTITTLMLIVFLNPTESIRLFIFIPAMISAIGFLQARLHFCVSFASKGLFNFSNDAGKIDSVDQAEFRAKDRVKALKIIAVAATISLLLVAFSLFI
jgi:hypothetical protein